MTKNIIQRYRDGGVRIMFSFALCRKAWLCTEPSYKTLKYPRLHDPCTLEDQAMCSHLSSHCTISSLCVTSRGVK